MKWSFLKRGVNLVEFQLIKLVKRQQIFSAE